MTTYRKLWKFLFSIINIQYIKFGSSSSRSNAGEYVVIKTGDKTMAPVLQTMRIMMNH